MARAKVKTKKSKAKPAKSASSKKATKRVAKKAGKAKADRSGAKKKALGPKAQAAVKKAADAIWAAEMPPHVLLQELHEVMLLKCLKEANGNYAAAAALFGPSRQSVQQYANSPLRDERWRPYQQNRRR